MATNALANSPKPEYDPQRRVVAVAGVCTCLGRSVLSVLDNDDRYERIIALDIAAPQIMSPKIEFSAVDLTQPGADAKIAQTLTEQGVDTVIHAAFLSEPTHNTEFAHELETIGTMHLLNACAAARTRKVILWSLTALYGPRPTNANFLSEETPLAGIAKFPFFADKIEAERLAARFREENPESILTVLRTAPILSRASTNYATRYFRQPVVPVLMGHDPLVQLCALEDAVAAFKLASDADYSGTFNIASEGVLPLRTALALAGRVVLPLPKSTVTSLTNILWMSQISRLPVALLDFLRYLCVADTGHSRQKLGFRPKHNIRQVIWDFAEAKSTEHRLPS